VLTVETTWFVFFYLTLFLGAIVLAWLGSEAYRWKTGRRFRVASLSCRLCGMVFLPSKTESLAECPRCGAKNENKNAVCRSAKK